VGYQSMPEDRMMLQAAVLGPLTARARFAAYRSPLVKAIGQIVGYSSPTGRASFRVAGIYLLLGAASLHPITVISVVALYSSARILLRLIDRYKDIVHARSIERIRRAPIKGNLTVEAAVALIRAGLPEPAVDHDEEEAARRSPRGAFIQDGGRTLTPTDDPEIPRMRPGSSKHR
jgi:hypothetical protein